MPLFTLEKALSEKWFFILLKFNGKELERIIGEINADKKSSQTLIKK